MPNRILALDLEGSHLAAVLVETSFRNYRFVSQVSEERDVSRPLVEQLSEFLARNRLEADTVLSALPGTSAAYRILQLPFRDRRKIQQTVPFEIESLVPIALEDGIVDFQVLARGEAGTRVFAALAPRAAIEEHLKTLAEAGLDPAIVDFAPLSTLNVLQLFDGDRPERYTFLHSRPGLATLALYHGEELEGLRVLDVTGDSSGDSLLREITWSLRTFNGKALDPAGSEGLAMLVAGAVPDDALRQLGSRFGIRVQRLEELPLRHVPGELRRSQGTFATAIGLALREIAERPTVGLDFRQEEYTYHRGQQELRSTLARLGTLAGVALVLFLLSNLVSYRELAGRYEALRQSVRQIFVATLPNEPAVLDETLQLTQAIETLRQRAQPGGGGVPLLEVLREVSVNAPAAPRMDASELTFDGESLRLRAETDSFEAVEEIKRGLSESEIFREVQVRDPRTTANGKVEFRLNILLGTEKEA